MKDYNYFFKTKTTLNSETEENKTDNDVVFGSYTLGDDYFETQSTGVFFLVFFF